MCGIASFFSINDRPAPVAVIHKLFLHIEPRGREAAGMAMWTDGSWRTYKCAGPISQNWDYFERQLRQFKPSVVLMHTRLPSHGSVEDNNNNHPIVGERSMVIHNGVVSVTGGRYTNALGRTDTEQFTLAMEKYGLEGGLERTNGSFAIFRVDFEAAPNTVQVLRNSRSPLTWGELEGRGLVMASTGFDNIVKPYKLHNVDIAGGYRQAECDVEGWAEPKWTSAPHAGGYSGFDPDAWEAMTATRAAAAGHPRRALLRPNGSIDYMDEE